MLKDAKYFQDLEREKFELWADEPTNETAAVDLLGQPADLLGDASSDVIVAEGDSWFDYAVGRDILHHLKKKYRYRIAKISDGGDTLENMVYGTKINKRNFRRKAAQWWETKEQLEKHKPKVFLFSGGGNDFAGPELLSLLNHKTSNLSTLRTQVVDEIFNTSSKQAFLDLCDRVWHVSSNTNIILHGYGYAIPDGRSVDWLWGRIRFAGPWLRPYFAMKGHIDPTATQTIMNKLVDRFNDMLAAVAQTDSRIHYLDLRPVIRKRDWENELHLDDDGYERVADEYQQLIQSI